MKSGATSKENCKAKNIALQPSIPITKKKGGLLCFMCSTDTRALTKQEAVAQVTCCAQSYEDKVAEGKVGTPGSGAGSQSSCSKWGFWCTTPQDLVGYLGPR